METKPKKENFIVQQAHGVEPHTLEQFGYRLGKFLEFREFRESCQFVYLISYISEWI